MIAPSTNTNETSIEFTQSNDYTGTTFTMG